jgi:hypothetical protein
MPNKKQMTDMVRKIVKHSQGLHDHKIMHPKRDWWIGLSFALLIFIASAYGSVYTYWKNKNITADTDVITSDETTVYRESFVKDALSRFDVRNKEREALMEHFSKVPETPPKAEEPAATSTEAVSTTTPKEPSGPVVNSGQ